MTGTANFIAVQSVDGGGFAFGLGLSFGVVHSLGGTVNDVRFVLAGASAVAVEIQGAVPTGGAAGRGTVLYGAVNARNGRSRAVRGRKSLP